MKKYSFVIAIIMSSLIGCGGDKDSSSLNLAQVAIEKIEAYADASNHTSIPVLEDYIKAGVTGVDNNNVGKINDAVKDIGAENVDTLEEIQALVDQLTTKVDADTTIPIITLKGKTTISLTVGDTYTEFGATAIDDIDGNISAKIKVISNVNMNKKGTYEVTYNVSDLAGNKAEERKRTVIINSPPEEITNRMPIASAVRINGVAKIGATLTLSYTFNDIDGDSEGASIIAWSTPSKELQRGTSKTFTIPKGYEGDSIGAWIHPVDSKGLESNIAYEASNNMLTIESSITNPDSLYLEEVNIPKYDINNPTHVLITTSNEMWTSSVLNDPNYKHFYVAPGKYQSRYINLTASGSKNDRRTLSLHNGNDMHPAALPDNEVANVYFHLANASYWTIDRMANLDRGVRPSMRLMGSKPGSKNGSSHNIINRWHGRSMGYGITIYPFSNFNTIQNSYFNLATPEGIITDSIGLALANANTLDTVTEGTKIINNDFRNMTDGIQLVKSTYIANGNPSYPSTIINGNRIWMDKERYSDGNYAKDGFSNDPNSQYMVGAENALDFKVASNDPQKPVLVTDNIMWGYRQADDTTPTNAGGAGTVISITRHSYNLKIKGNIIFDSQSGMGATHFYRGSEFSDNILADMGQYNPPTSAHPNGRYPYSLYISAALDMSDPLGAKYNNNSFIRQYTNSLTGSGRTISVHQNSHGNLIENNLFIDTQAMGGSIKNHTRKNSWYYNQSGVRLGGTEVLLSTSREAKMSDYTFTYERFTKVPKQKTLKGIITTKESPHYKKAGSNIMVK